MLQSEVEGNVGTVELEGRVTYVNHPELRTAVGSLLATPGLTTLRLDLSAAKFVDSSTLGMFLLIREKAGAQGANVVLAHPSPSVKSTLKVVQFDRLFQVED